MNAANRIPAAPAPGQSGTEPQDPVESLSPTG